VRDIKRTELVQVTETMNYPGREPHDVVDEFDLPEDLVSILEPYLGNGDGGVTVGGELAVKDFGNGGGCSCFIKVSANNNLDDLLAVADIVGSAVEHFCYDGVQRVQILHAAALAGQPYPELPLRTLQGVPKKTQTPKGPSTSKRATTASPVLGAKFRKL